ncbi:hypothetical protein FPV67DRAFT_182053 [Lyophyllum atratum]|nr:hypothetical protein FPV67DRAFT_182053 [Lyophyllum atratum]
MILYRFRYPSFRLVISLGRGLSLVEPYFKIFENCINRLVNNLDKIIKEGQASFQHLTVVGKLRETMALRTQAVKLTSTFDEATKDALPSVPVTDQEGRSFLAAIEEMETPVINGFAFIVTMRDEPLLARIPVVRQMARRDLGNLDTSRNNFMTALLASVPASVQPELVALTNRFDAGFADILKTYDT